MNEEQKSKVNLALAMAVFGTIGLFVKNINLPTPVIAMFRALLGAGFLIAFVLLKKHSSKAIDLQNIKQHYKYLFLSSACMVTNWILLFESYNYTTVAASTVCYYMAPVFVIIAAPFIIREKLTRGKVICVLTALLGAACVSGIFKVGISGIAELRGIFLALGAAALYACVILINKKLEAVAAYDATITQLVTAGVLMLVYTALTEDYSAMVFDPKSVGLLLIVGMLHTGVAYAMYFSSLKALKAQTLAIFSYIDPVVAILLSALILREPLGILGVVGSVLVLGSTLVSEKLR